MSETMRLENFVLFLKILSLYFCKSHKNNISVQKIKDIILYVFLDILLQFDTVYWTKSKKITNNHATVKCSKRQSRGSDSSMNSKYFYILNQIKGD